MTQLNELLPGIDILYDHARESTAGLYTLEEVALVLAGYAALAARPDLLHRGLLLCGRSVAGLFACAGQSEGMVSFPMEDADVFELAATVETTLATTGVWINGFQAALAVRDSTTADRLAAAHIVPSRPGSGVETGEFSYLYAECLRSVWSQDGRAGELIGDVLEAADPAKLPRDMAEWASHIVVPAAQLLFEMHLRDAAKFSRSLTTAIEKHRAYWSHATRQRDPKGIVATQLLAVTALARMAGLKVESESPYVPEVLLRAPQ